jgi:hypothetical protein
MGPARAARIQAGTAATPSGPASGMRQPTLLPSYPSRALLLSSITIAAITITLPYMAVADDRGYPPAHGRALPQANPSRQLTRYLPSFATVSASMPG